MPPHCRFGPGPAVLLVAAIALTAWSGAAAAREPPPGGDNLASITIDVSVCPADYARRTDGTDCYPNATGEGTPFTLTNLATGEPFAGTTGTDGFAAIEGIDEDGTYRLEESPPDAANPAVVLCSEGGAPVPVAVGGNRADLNLTTADDLRCDWFVIPLGEGGTPAADRTPGPSEIDLPIYVLNCQSPRQAPAPAAAGFPPADCALAVGVDAIVHTENGDEVGRCTTNEAGTCTVPIPAATSGPRIIVRRDMRTVADGYEPVDARTEIAGDSSFAVLVNARSSAGASPLPIYAVICDREPETASPFAAVFPPEGCAAAEGTVVTVTLRDGTEVGACTIDAAGVCRVEVPSSSTLVVGEDEATLPDGYAPRKNPVVTRPYGEFASALFVNLPEASGTPEPATGLSREPEGRDRRRACPVPGS